MALISIAVSWGFGRHLKTLEPSRSIQALKYDYIQQPFHVMSSCFGRISFALFLVEIIQKFIARKRFLYSLMALQFAVNGSTAILIMAQCRPVQALWNRKIENNCLSPRVQEYYSFFQGCRSRYRPADSGDAFLLIRPAVNVITDFILAVFPATFIWQLNMKLRKKIGLTLVLGLGILSVSAQLSLPKGLGSSRAAVLWSQQPSRWCKLNLWHPDPIIPVGFIDRFLCLLPVTNTL